MMTAVEAYLALRRTAGFAMSNAEYLLRSFARFAAARGQRHVRATTLIDWASQSPSLAQRHTRYQAVCNFVSQLRLEDPGHELPPPNYFGYKKTRRIPHIYSPAEVSRIMLAASRLNPRGTLRPQTYATLIGLLASTGMRVSEALGLRVGERHFGGSAHSQDQVPEDAPGPAARHCPGGAAKLLGAASEDAP